MSKPAVHTGKVVKFFTNNPSVALLTLEWISENTVTGIEKQFGFFVVTCTSDKMAERLTRYINDNS